MKIYFYGSRALVRVLAAGRLVWCLETGEGFQMTAPSVNQARRVARRILADDDRQTFFFLAGGE